jgi:hypothetical protein
VKGEKSNVQVAKEDRKRKRQKHKRCNKRGNKRGKRYKREVSHFPRRSELEVLGAASAAGALE